MNTAIEPQRNRNSQDASSGNSAAVGAAPAGAPARVAGHVASSSSPFSTAAPPSSSGTPLPRAPERPLIAAAATPLRDLPRPPATPLAPRHKRRRRQQRHGSRQGLAAAAHRSLWRSPMTAAVLIGTLLVGLLCVYVYAYARVTMASIETAALRKELRRAEQQEEELLAEISQQRMPHTVARRAKDLGLEMAPAQAVRELPGQDLAPNAPERTGVSVPALAPTVPTTSITPDSHKPPTNP